MKARGRRAKKVGSREHQQGASAASVLFDSLTLGPSSKIRKRRKGKKKGKRSDNDKGDDQNMRRMTGDLLWV